MTTVFVVCTRTSAQTSLETCSSTHTDGSVNLQYRSLVMTNDASHPVLGLTTVVRITKAFDVRIHCEIEYLGYIAWLDPINPMM